jgi:hypothetical protein
MKEHLRALLADYPNRLAEFRRRVLPFSGLHVAFNAAAAACFVSALWFFPPAQMEHWDLIFVRYGSVLLTPVAFLMDAVAFARMLMATFARDTRADGLV